MNRQIVVVLCLLLAAVGLHLATRERPEAPVDSPEALVQKMLPKAVALPDVREIRVFKGKEPDGGLLFRRSGEIWVAPRKWDAACLKAKIEALVEEVNKMEGQVRAEEKELLPQFMLGDREAVHLAFFGQNSAEIEHVLLGKKGGDYRSAFARRSVDTKAWHVGNNPLSALGVYTDAVEATLDHASFLDKIALSLSEDLTRIEIRATGEVIVAEYLTESTAEAEARRVGTAPVELRKYWAITKPAGFAYDSAKIENYARSVKSVNARDLEDPAVAAGRDHGTASVELRTVNGKIAKLRFASRSGSDFPLRVEGGGKDCYLLYESEYNRIVKSLSDFAKEKPPEPPKVPAATPAEPVVKVPGVSAPLVPDVKPEEKKPEEKPGGQKDEPKAGAAPETKPVGKGDGKKPENK